jgi:uncharacterized protein YndB with AHSA1/START domain
MLDSGKLKVTALGDRQIVLTRNFDAPRELVFAAYTQPELLKRWLGVGGGWTLAVCEIDLRVGGAYRWVWRGPDGGEMGMGGVYREIVPNERLVCTEKFDQAWYPGEGVCTVELAEQGGKTALTTTILYESKEARDAVLKSPMEQGVSASYDRLAEILREDAKTGR